MKRYTIKFCLLLVLVISFASCKKTKVNEDTDTPSVNHPYGAGMGKFSVFVATNFGVGNINCYIDGIYVGAIVNANPNTTCGNADVNKILTAGVHNFNATATSSTGTITWNYSFTITEDVCKIDQLTCSSCGGGGGGTSYGTAVFFLNQNAGGTVTVNCGGQTKYITSYFTSGTPGCNSTAAANFYLPAGTYSYTASSSTNNWSGSVAVPANTCSENLLNVTTTSNIAHLTVWSSNTSVGTITVTCGGITKYITTKYSSQPSCQASGCAIFDVPYGNYSINASAAGGYSWNPFTITMNTSGQCYIVQLQ